MRSCGSHLSVRFPPVSDPGIGALTPDYRSPDKVEVALGSTNSIVSCSKSHKVRCGGAVSVFQYPAPTTSMCPSM